MCRRRPLGSFVVTAVRVSGAVCRRVGHGVPAVSGRCRDGRCGLAVVGTSRFRSAESIGEHGILRVVAIVALGFVFDTAHIVVP